MFRLRSDSRLLIFLNNTGSNPMPKYFQWTYLVWEMQSRILSLKLLDLSNPIIVICSSLLEWAIQRKSFLIYELERILEQEVEFDTKMKDPPIVMNPIDEMHPNRRWFQTIAMSFAGIFDVNFDKRDAEILKIIHGGKVPLVLDPFFALIMNASESSSRTNLTFSYNEAWQLTIRYILQRKDHLIDSRSPDIMVLKNDPLRFAFKVNSLHKDQLGKLVRSQLYLPAPRISSNPSWKTPNFNKNAVEKKLPMAEPTYQLFNSQPINNPLRSYLPNQSGNQTHTSMAQSDNRKRYQNQLSYTSSTLPRPMTIQPEYNPRYKVLYPSFLSPSPQSRKCIQYQATHPSAVDTPHNERTELTKGSTQISESTKKDF